MYLIKTFKCGCLFLSSDHISDTDQSKNVTLVILRRLHKHLISNPFVKGLNLVNWTPSNHLGMIEVVPRLLRASVLANLEIEIMPISEISCGNNRKV